jgi:membrane protease YdiL (CAAX protease family)
VQTSPRRDLVRFAILTAAITGGLWLLLLASSLDIREGAGFWIFGVATSGPSLAALVLFVIRRSWDGPRPEGQRVVAPWVWLPASIVLGIAPPVLANLVANTGAVATMLDRMPAVLAEFGGGLMFVVLFLIAGPIAEEFGWRGYAQPRLRQRLGVIGTSVVLGIAWGLWHVPLYFLPGTGQYATGLFTINGLMFMLTCIPLSLLYLFVSERLRGGVWAAIVIHFAGNAIGAFLPSEAAIVPVLEFGVTLALAAGLYVAWHRERRTVAAPAPRRAPERVAGR